MDTNGQVYVAGTSKRDYAVVKYDAEGIFTLSYLFAEGSPPSCLDAADANDDGGIDMPDGIFILQNLFASGPAIPPPYPGCGIDPTVDELGCSRFAPCE